MPDPNENVIAGVPWGRCDHIFTPAFWYFRSAIANNDGLYQFHRLGSNLFEEVAACLLGGFGMPADVGLAAFNRLRDRNLLRPGVEEVSINRALSEPLPVSGKTTRYRFPNQKARYVSRALDRLGAESFPVDDEIEFREKLRSLEGIGFKTASWITRNFLNSDRVAILDVHILRAGLLAGIFRPSHDVTRDYPELESRLICFANGLGVRLSQLDAVMWFEMRKLGWLALQTLAARKRGGL